MPPAMRESIMFVLGTVFRALFALLIAGLALSQFLAIADAALL